MASARSVVNRAVSCAALNGPMGLGGRVSGGVCREDWASGVASTLDSRETESERLTECGGSKTVVSVEAPTFTVISGSGSSGTPKLNTLTVLPGEGEGCCLHTPLTTA